MTLGVGQKVEELSFRLPENTCVTSGVCGACEFDGVVKYMQT